MFTFPQYFHDSTMAAPRLTEEEVHAACAEIAELGEHPSALKLLGKLERGSLTTITKYLKSWNSPEDPNAGMTCKDIEPSKYVVELEKLRVLYELSLAELNTIKTELQASNKAWIEAEKLAANLEGQLAVYISLKPSEGDVKQTQKDHIINDRSENHLGSHWFDIDRCSLGKKPNG